MEQQQQQQSNSRPVTGYPAPAAYSNGHPPPQSNAAYPYPAPPPTYQSNPYPYAYNNYANPPNPRVTFFRRFIIFMIGLFIVFGSVVFIVWLVLRPQIPEFRVDSASLSNFTLSPSLQVTGTWKLGFRVLNPNKKMSVSYEDVQSSIYYDSQFLAQTLIPPFDQGTRNQTAVNASLSASGSYVRSWVLDAVNRDRAGGTVTFNARVLAEVAFRAGGWRPRRRILRVLCDEVPIGISANGGSGSLVGGAKECRVGL